MLPVLATLKAARSSGGIFRHVGLAVLTILGRIQADFHLLCSCRQTLRQPGKGLRGTFWVQVFHPAK